LCCVGRSAGLAAQWQCLYGCSFNGSKLVLLSLCPKSQVISATN